MAGIILHLWQVFKESTRNYWMEGGGGEGGGGHNHRAHIFTRDETGFVYLPSQLERTLQLYW